MSGEADGSSERATVMLPVRNSETERPALAPGRVLQYSDHTIDCGIDRRPRWGIQSSHPYSHGLSSWKLHITHDHKAAPSSLTVQSEVALPNADQAFTPAYFSSIPGRRPPDDRHHRAARSGKSRSLPARSPHCRDHARSHRLFNVGSSARMMAAACRLVRPRNLVSCSSRLGLAEGEELETNILSQDFAGVRVGSPEVLKSCLVDVVLPEFG
jgi:hypothetical protein